VDISKLPAELVCSLCVCVEGGSRVWMLLHLDYESCSTVFDSTFHMFIHVHTDLEWVRTVLICSNDVKCCFSKRCTLIFFFTHNQLLTLLEWCAHMDTQT
jgi:hypothetical protein